MTTSVYVAHTVLLGKAMLIYLEDRIRVDAAGQRKIEGAIICRPLVVAQDIHSELMR